MMIPGGPWLRPLNFIITSLVVSRPISRFSSTLGLTFRRPQFVYVSNQVAGATGKLTTWICAGGASLPKTNVPTRGAAVAPPATGGSGATTGEYVALSTVGDGVSDEKSAPTAPPQTAFAKGVDFIKKDLRIRFLAIFVGLVTLNWICGFSISRLFPLFLLSPYVPSLPFPTTSLRPSEELTSPFADPSSA